MEKHKIFISGLPFSCTNEMLEDLCKEHGTIKAVRLVTNRSGKPKVEKSFMALLPQLIEMNICPVLLL